jgi:alpha/beta superfamily hydrolase
LSAAQGCVVLSHGMDSGPQATKVSALAVAAAASGWRSVRMDYRDLDAHGLAAAAAPRIARLRGAVPRDARCVLVGSSFGAFVSGLVACERAVAGVFLLATPPLIPGYAQAFALPEGTPACLVHGWRDEVCPVEAMFNVARAYRAEMLLLDDDHRLGAHVDVIAAQFARFLARIAA